MGEAEMEEKPLPKNFFLWGVVKAMREQEPVMLVTWVVMCVLGYSLIGLLAYNAVSFFMGSFHPPAVGLVLWAVGYAVGYDDGKEFQEKD